MSACCLKQDKHEQRKTKEGDNQEKHKDDKEIMTLYILESSLPKNSSFHHKFKNYKLFNLTRQISRESRLVMLVHVSLYVEDCETDMKNNRIHKVKY